ncbi:VOC family protein [Speluncibacter jeojiensis]|uniref:VOC family protein n=1 Tax=Speluncibacter jeojiensis TaxID=2710754 RepID=A0A9X4M423_9ACTN|nr:VOC family protein [Corynebacteriales bacterium D3-21]
MSVYAKAPAGAPCWVDLYTSDAAAAREFYGRMFGWEAEEPAPEFGGYFNFTLDGVRVAGCMPAMEGMGTPDVWSIYFATDDADKTLSAITAGGGQVESPAMAVGDLGTMAVVVDPNGGRFGLWQPGTHAGFGLIAEHGAPGWFELYTRDYGSALEFYRSALGWDVETISDTPAFRYTVVRDGDQQLAGVMDATDFLSAGTPPQWTTYFAVDDADAAATAIGAAGGAVVRAPEDTPYGRIAEVRDPMGAAFRLVGPNISTPAE